MKCFVEGQDRTQVTLFPNVLRTGLIRTMRSMPSMFLSIYLT